MERCKNFWSCKFTENSNLKKKIESYKLKKIKIIYKNWKTFIEFGDIKIEKQKFHQHKRLISIKNVDINKTV